MDGGEKMGVPGDRGIKEGSARDAGGGGEGRGGRMFVSGLKGPDMIFIYA